jgi:hypothetical protein
MKSKITAAVSSAAASATLTTNEAGLLPGMTIDVELVAPVGGFSGTARWQTSQNGTTWTNAGVDWVTTAGGVDFQQIKLEQYLRVNVSAYASGSVKGRAQSNIG